MGKEIISDFLVRLGFDGKQVTKGVAQAEASLARLRKIKVANARTTKNVELEQAVKATRQRIQSQQLVDRIKAKEASKAAVERRRELTHLKTLLRAKAALRRTDAFASSGIISPDAKAEMRRRLSAATNLEQIKQIRAETGRIAKGQRLATAQMAKQLSLSNALKFSMSGILASVKNLARSWISIFAIIGGALAGLKFTQQFQALDASMLAVSESTKSAADNVAYLKGLVKELPVDITTAGDNFKNMLASGRESMGEAGVKELFTSLSEFGTALQVDPERMNRGMQAISQMLNKGQIMAEELKQQFAEQMPGGIQVFSRALNMTTEELFAAMENGELLAKDVLPLVSKELAKTARANGALEKSLKTSRSQWTIFVSNFKMLFDGFGSSRLDKGIGSFIQALSKLLQVVKPLAQILFWLIGVAFDFIGIIAKGVLSAFDPWLKIIKALSKPLTAIGDSLNYVDGAFMGWLGNLAKFLPFLNPFLAMALVIGAIAEEITNIFTGHAQGFLAGEGETIAERMSNGFIAKWMVQLGTWWDSIFIPWFTKKADQMANILKDALKLVLPDWMVDGVGIEVKNLGNITGALDSTGAAVGISNLSKYFDIKGMALSTARGLDSLLGTQRKTPSAVINLNIDGKETIRKEISLDRDLTLQGAM